MRFLLIGLSALGIVAAAGIVAIFLLLRHYSEGLPDYRALADYKPKVVTRVHAGDGELLAEFSTEKRIFVPIASIPTQVKEAFISAEDKNFYQHKGVDPEGIMRAAITDLKNLHSEKRPVGASTITQQVARNFLLTNEVSIARKIKEMILAYRIEQVLTKDQILELYLNEIYLGLNSYGVAAAALDYFNKPLDELTVAEMSFLAAIPKNPNKYFREKNRDAALERRNYVINRMYEDKYITQAQAAEASASPLGFHPPTDSDKVPAGHFTEEVRRELLAAYGKDGLYGGGLSVRTTLDPKLQAIAVQSLRDGLVSYDERHGWRGPVTHLPNMNSWAEQVSKIVPPEGAETWRLAAVIDADADSAKVGFGDGKTTELAMADMRWTGKAKANQLLQIGDVVLTQYVEAKPDDKKATDKKKDQEVKPATPAFHYVLRQMPEVNGALVALDPHTGRVLALVGGMSYESSEFDRATQAMRQPGSSFKPFVYLAALDSGFTPSTIVLDAPVEIDQGPGLPLWKPVNFDHEFLGPLPLRVALEKSLDTATVRVGQAIGMPKIVEYAKKFGISDNLPPFISSVIGAGETTLMRMVTAYAELDNGGKKIVPTLIDRIQDREGKTLFRHDGRTCQGCTGVDWTQQAVPEIPDNRPQIQDPRTAYQMVEMLEGVVQRGTARSLAALGHPLAGKTGTTNDAKDLWFLGFSPDLVVGVFVGYDDPKTLGKREQGATVAVPVFKEFMSIALADQPPIPFRIPPGLRVVRVDASSGEPASSGSGNSLWEAFLPGTEPGSDHPPPPGADLLTNAGSQNLPSATTGTGGIYLEPVRRSGVILSRPETEIWDSPMTEVLIDAMDEGRFSAYLAEPARGGKAPGMIVIQEIFGINRNIQSICDDYAAQGYVAIAPDLFWRQEPGVQLDSNTKEGWARAMELFQGFSQTKGVEDLIATLAWLRTDPRVTVKVGAVGYCLGGKLAYLMSTRSDVDAAVGYYGVGIEGSIGEAGAITHPLMLHAAEKDGFSSPEALAKIREGLAPIVHATVHSYPGVDHAFARKGGEHYDEAAANLADGRTAAFFAENLKV